MTEYFKVLSDTEFDKLKDAIALITVYIGAADGNFDDEEYQWAEKVTKIRAYNLPDTLGTFYEGVGADFQERVDNYAKTLTVTETRNSFVADKLAALNPILAKLNPKLGAELYSSYVSFAKHVAKASGGFLGFFSIGPKESALLDLEMIIPIIWEEEEEEQEEENS